MTCKHNDLFCFLGVSLLLHAIVIPFLPGLAAGKGQEPIPVPHVIHASLVYDDIVAQKPSHAAQHVGKSSSSPTTVRHVDPGSRPGMTNKKKANAPKRQPASASVSVTEFAEPKKKGIDWGAVQSVVASYSERELFSAYAPAVRSSAQTDYIRSCREKILRQGEMSNFARFDGRVVVRIVIARTGELADVSADVSDEIPANLRDAAMDVVRNASPFFVFSNALSAETMFIRFGVAINFISESK